MYHPSPQSAATAMPVPYYAVTPPAYNPLLPTPAAALPVNPTLLTHHLAATVASVAATVAGQKTQQEDDEEEAERRKNMIPQVYEGKYFNLNESIGANIISSDYFKSLMALKTFESMIDEIYNEVTYVEPFVIGKASRVPSTAFCLLYRFFVFGLTPKQMNVLLTHKDSPYIRAIGFLYLRYVAEPKTLWDWFSPYMADKEEFQPGGGENKEIKTMGTYVRELLENSNYYTTILRRIPYPIQINIKLKLAAFDEKQKKAVQNEKYRKSVKVGERFMCEFSEDGKLYEAEITEVLENGNFFVTYTEYGNQEEVSIGALQFDDKHKKRSSSREKRSPRRSRSPDKRRKRSRSRDRKRSRSRSRDRKRSRSRSRDRRKRSRSRSNSRKRRSRSHSKSRKSRSRSPKGAKSEKELLEEIRRKEREAAAATGRDYARRPTSYKTSLSSKLTAATNRKRSRTPPAERKSSSSSSRRREDSPPKKKQLSAEAQERRSALIAKYGDASSAKKAGGDYADKR